MIKCLTFGQKCIKLCHKVSKNFMTHFKEDKTMARSIADRITLSEELMRDSNHPWVPILFTPLEANASGIYLPVNPKCKYVPYTVLRHAFAVAEFNTDCDMKQLCADVCLNLPSYNNVFTYHRCEYYATVHPLFETLRKQLAEEVMKFNRSRRLILELRYHLTVPQIVTLYLPRCLDSLPIKRV